MNCFTPYADLSRQTFMPLKASQKLGEGCKWCGVGPKPVYEIHPWSCYYCLADTLILFFMSGLQIWSCNFMSGWHSDLVFLSGFQIWSCFFWSGWHSDHTGHGSKPGLIRDGRKLSRRNDRLQIATSLATTTLRCRWWRRFRRWRKWKRGRRRRTFDKVTRPVLSYQIQTQFGLNLIPFQANSFHFNKSSPQKCG